MINMGTMVKTAPAISRLGLDPDSVTKFHKPTITGRQTSFVVTIKGHRNAFHDWMNVNKVAVRTAGLLIGKHICIRKRKCPAPSNRQCY